MSEYDPNSAHDVMNATRQDDALMRRMRELEAENAALKARVPDNVVQHPMPFSGEVPRYRLNDPVFFDDTFIAAETYDQINKRWHPTEIEFTGTPNLVMVPVNDAARIKMREYIEYQTECQRRKAESQGRIFTGMVTDQGVMIAQNMQDARASVPEVTVRMPEDKGFVPSMPHTDEARALERRRPGRPRKVQVVGPSSDAEMRRPAVDHTIGQREAG
jgi:hypothetical protein